MSKNFIEYSTHLFNLITSDATLPTKGQMRVAKNPDKAAFRREVQDFKGLVVEDVSYAVPGVKIAGISLRDKHLILITSIRELLSTPVLTSLEELGISLVDTHTGIFLAVVKDASLKRNDTLPAEYYEENIFSQQDDRTYNGHSLQDLEKCIEPFSLFEIDQNSLLYCRDHRDVGQLICTFVPALRVLPLEPLAPSFQDLLIKGGHHLRNENVFNSLTSAHWRHSFLELYRCIEALYSLPRAISLRDKLKIPLSGATVAKACYGELGWKRKEEDSIKRIFQLLPNSIAVATKIENVELFIGHNLNFSSDEFGRKSYEKLGELVYRIRNSLVHHLELDDEFIPLNDKDWLLILRFLISAIKNIYSTYDSELIC